MGKRQLRKWIREWNRNDLGVELSERVFWVFIYRAQLHVLHLLVARGGETRRGRERKRYSVQSIGNSCLNHVTLTSVSSTASDGEQTEAARHVWSQQPARNARHPGRPGRHRGCLTCWHWWLRTQVRLYRVADQTNWSEKCHHLPNLHHSQTSLPEEILSVKTKHSNFWTTNEWPTRPNLTIWLTQQSLPKWCWQLFNFARALLTPTLYCGKLVYTGYVLCTRLVTSGEGFWE